MVKKKEDGVTKRIITATGEDITGLSPVERIAKLKGLKEGKFQGPVQPGMSAEFFERFGRQVPEQTVTGVEGPGGGGGGGEREIIGTFENVEGGKGGITIPGKGGKPPRTYFGLNTEDIANILKQQGIKPEDFPTIAESAETVGIQRLAEGVGATGPINPPTADLLSYEQAAKSALGLTAAGISGGAAAGAAAGLIGGPASPVTVPAGAVVGAIVGGVSTFVAGFRSNLKTQRRDILSGESTNLRKQEQNLLKIVMDTNQGGDPTRNLGYFNEQLSIIDQNYANLKLQTTDSLSLWLGEDGHVELERYATFNAPGGMRDILIAQMQQALLTPDPSKIVNFAEVEEE